MSNDVEWSAADQATLEAARRDVAPPASLEDRTIAALHANRLMRPRGSPWLWRIASTAVVVAAFGAGLTWRGPRNPAEDSRAPRFVLLLYGGEADPSSTRRIEYAAWARGVAREGTAISGEELSDVEEVIPGATWTGVPAAERPRGYFVVSAPSLAEARRIAASCPHVRHGGGVVIRPIVAGP